MIFLCDIFSGARGMLNSLRNHRQSHDDTILMILVWTAGELSCGQQVINTHTHTGRYTDTGDDITRRPKLASDNNHFATDWNISLMLWVIAKYIEQDDTWVSMYVWNYRVTIARESGNSRDAWSAVDILWRLHFSRARPAPARNAWYQLGTVKIENIASHIHDKYYSYYSIMPKIKIYPQWINV